MKQLGLLVVVGFGLGLSACSSGLMTGGSFNNNGVNQNVVTEYPVETALLNIYTKESKSTLSAIVYGHKESIEIQVTPKGAMVFENKSVQGAEESIIYRYDDEVVEESVGINYYTPDPLKFHGFTSSLGEYSIAETASTIPRMASLGMSGHMATENVYEDSSKRNKVEMYTQDWSLSAASPSSAWLCIDSSENMLMDSELTSATSECYEINAKGDILASKLSYLPPAGSSEPLVTYSSR